MAPPEEVVLEQKFLETWTLPSLTLYENYLGSSPVYSECYWTYWRGQTFTPQVSHDLYRVGLYLSRVGTPVCVIIAIKATDVTGLPTGPDLASFSFRGSALPEGNPTSFIYVNLCGYPLVLGTRYAIILKSPSSSTIGKVLYGRDSTNNPYPRGEMVSSNDGGETWTAYPDLDIYFQEWGIP